MELDFSKMKWKVIDVSPDNYPDLAERFKEYTGQLETINISVDKFIRFTVLCYHQFSPLVEKIDDVVVRKKKALELIEYNNEELLLPITEPAVGYAILQFLKFENNTKHMNLMMYQETLSKYQLDLMTAKGADRNQTLDAIERLTDIISKLTVEHLRSDTSLTDFAPSFNVLEKRKIFPEEQ